MEMCCKTLGPVRRVGQMWEESRTRRCLSVSQAMKDLGKRQGASMRCAMR